MLIGCVTPYHHVEVVTSRAHKEDAALVKRHHARPVEAPPVAPNEPPTACLVAVHVWNTSDVANWRFVHQQVQEHFRSAPESETLAALAADHCAAEPAKGNTGPPEFRGKRQHRIPKAERLRHEHEPFFLGPLNASTACCRSVLGNAANLSPKCKSRIRERAQSPRTLARRALGLAHHERRAAVERSPYLGMWVCW